MVNISDRWNRDKTNDFQFAFFNGLGWESWESIWGIWNGITPRDAEATLFSASQRRVGINERPITACFQIGKPQQGILWPCRTLLLNLDVCSLLNAFKI